MGALCIALAVFSFHFSCSWLCLYMCYALNEIENIKGCWYFDVSSSTWIYAFQQSQSELLQDNSTIQMQINR